MVLHSIVYRFSCIVFWTIFVGSCLNTSVAWGNDQVTPEEEFDDLFKELDLALGNDPTSVYEGDNTDVAYLCDSIEKGNRRKVISFLKNEKSVFKKKHYGDGGYYTNSQVLLEWRCDFPKKVMDFKEVIERRQKDPLLTSSDLELYQMLNDNIQIPPLLSIFVQSDVFSRLNSDSLISNAEALKIDVPSMMSATFKGRNYLDWYLISDRVNFIANPLSFKDYDEWKRPFHRNYAFKRLSKDVSCKTISPCQLWRPNAQSLDDLCLLIKFRSYEEKFSSRFDELFRKNPARSLQENCYIGRWYDDVQSPFEVALDYNWDFPYISSIFSTLDETSLAALRKFRSTDGDTLISKYDQRRDSIVSEMEYNVMGYNSLEERDADIVKFKSEYALERVKLQNLGFD